MADSCVVSPLVGEHLITPAEAAQLMRRHPETIRSWCVKAPALGRKVGGRWVVRTDALRQIADGTPLAMIR